MFKIYILLMILQKQTIIIRLELLHRILYKYIELKKK